MKISMNKIVKPAIGNYKTKEPNIQKIEWDKNYI